MKSQNGIFWMVRWWVLRHSSRTCLEVYCKWEVLPEGLRCELLLGCIWRGNVESCIWKVLTKCDFLECSYSYQGGWATTLARPCRRDLVTQSLTYKDFLSGSNQWCIRSI
jgi:hypothetical protein